jgi:hypothetical protein
MNWFLVLPGVAAAAWSARQLWGGWASRRWPVAHGRLETRAISEEAGVRGGSYYTAHVRYRYQVGAAAFTGRRLRFGAPWWGESHATAVAALGRARPGDEVAVYYNPRDPAVAVLRPGVAFADVVGLLVGVALVVAGTRGS